MISFDEWVRANEISYSGGLPSLGDGPSFRAASRLSPDLRSTKVFGFVVRPSLLASLRRYGAARGLPREVEAVLDNMEEDVAMLSNEDLAVFSSLVGRMKSDGGFASIAGEELERALDGAVATAMEDLPPKGF